MTTQRTAPALPDLLRYSTSTVGLITTVDARGAVNLMSAEWTHMVAREPPHFAVAFQETNHSTGLVLERGEFGLVLCDASMAGLADFAGSFSGAEMDKSGASGVRLRDPVATGTPVVDGGVLRAECRVVHAIELPGYVLVVGEAVWLEADQEANRDPLVKHGRMYRLGEQIRARAVTVSATPLPGGAVQVCATAQGASRVAVRWTISRGDTPVHTETAGTDLDVVLTQAHLAGTTGALRVARPGYGSASVDLPAP